MVNNRSRLPVYWNRTKYPIVAEADCTGDNGKWQCPYCHTQSARTEIIEVTQRGMFEDVHHSLSACGKCHKRVAIFSTTKGRKHVSV